ncbi:hypothetical protein PybrP1_007442 [[Pythium] brassicae (nom. inval.)]|nr:hypothetical protein PybrP1_007442 [[Pythium] brassicae (nom. inval.)]
MNAENGGRDRPRVVLYADSTIADGGSSVGRLDDDDDDAHSELDLDLYDTDGVVDSWDPHVSISGSVLSESPALMTTGTGTAPRSAAEAYSYSTSHLLYQQQQQQHEQAEKELRHRRIDETGTDDTSSATESRRRMPTFDTMSSHSSQNYRFNRMPMAHQPYIRTDFTTQDGVGTPTNPYEMLGTPPGDPPSTRPDEMPTLEAEVKLSRTMKPGWVLAVALSSFGLGVLGLALDTPTHVGYWLNVVGSLYVRAVNCITLPMAFCQVVVSVSTLTTKKTLTRLWLKTMAIYLGICVVSTAVALVVAYSVRPLMREHGDLGLKLSHKKFAFKCPNGKFFAQESDGSLSCRGAAVATNTTFPWLVDSGGTLGIEELVASVDLTSYMFRLLNVYFPNNVVDSFASDRFLSALVVATVVGVAVMRSFRGLQSRSNPLLRLFMHIYSSLFSMLEWLQQAVFVAIVPMLAGSVLISPLTGKYVVLAKYYCMCAGLLAVLHCAVIVPTAFYLFTRRNPYAWLRRVATPIVYALVLQSSFLPIAVATKAVMRTKEVPPAVFGAIYPTLAALNTCALAIGLPVSLMFVAAFSGCQAQPSFLGVLKLFGLTLIDCMGEAALARPQLAFFLTIWRNMCTNEDTPSAVLILSALPLFVFRLSAIANTIMNLAIVRMVAATNEAKLHA